MRQVHPPRQQSNFSPKIGLFTILSAAFQANEINYAMSHGRHRNQWMRFPMTDDEIARRIVFIIPDQSKLLTRPPQKYYGFWPSINYYRGRYNRGMLTGRLVPESIPEAPSFRYNSNHLRVSGRSGLRLLTPKEIARTIIEHQSRIESTRQDAHVSLSRD